MSDYTPEKTQNEVSEITDSTSEMSQIQFIQAVEDKLEQALREDFVSHCYKVEVLNRAAHHLCLGRKAKRMRSRLVFIFGQTLSISIDELVNIAAAAELIHAASLLHDDVIDESSMRRGKATVNARWDNKVAVLAGDFVLAIALLMIQKYPPKIYSQAVNMVLNMTKGVMMEVQARKSLDCDLPCWRMIADAKTGLLFAWCGEVTAYLASDLSAAEHFGKCARHLGMAFQIADDLKDILGLDLTKEQFSDIRNRNPNVVIVEAMRYSSCYQKLQKLWQAENMSWTDIQELGRDILESQAPEQIYTMLRSELDKAISSLGPYQQMSSGVAINHWTKLLWESMRQS